MNSSKVTNLIKRIIVLNYNYIVYVIRRMGQDPTYSAHNVGFRCAASSPDVIEDFKKKDPRYGKKDAVTETKRPRRVHRKSDMYDPTAKTNKLLKKEEL